MTVSDRDSTSMNPTSTPSSQPTWVPRQKVTASGIAGAVVTFTVIILNTYVFIGDRADQKVTAELSSAATVLLSFVVGYLVPPSPRERSTGTGINAKSAFED